MTRNASDQVMVLFAQDVASEVLTLKSLNALVLKRSASLVGELQSPLATLDALHLATALIHGATQFFTTDDQLARAANESGLTVWPEFSA
jgi:predicted nucleic acid-binding protein